MLPFIHKTSDLESINIYDDFSGFWCFVISLYYGVFSIQCL